MSFSLKSFFVELAELAPAAISLAKSIDGQVPNETKTAVASQALQAAGALAQAIEANNPAEAEDVATATGVVQSILTAVTEQPAAPLPAA